jgi:hypothetical protein
MFIEAAGGVLSGLAVEQYSSLYTSVRSSVTEAHHFYALRLWLQANILMRLRLPQLRLWFRSKFFKRIKLNIRSYILFFFPFYVMKFVVPMQRKSNKII